MANVAVYELEHAFTMLKSMFIHGKRKRARVYSQNIKPNLIKT